MTKQNFIEHYDDLTGRALSIFLKKSQDYATDQDVLGNFQEASRISGGTLTPKQVWWIYANKHWTAISKHALGSTLQSEPIQERICDLINYLAFLHAMIKELDEGDPDFPQEEVRKEASS